MGVIENIRKTSKVAIDALEEKIKRDDRERQFHASLDTVIDKCINLGHIKINGDCEIVDNQSLSTAITTSLSQHVFETPTNIGDLSNNLCLSIFNSACRMSWVQNDQTHIAELEQSLSIFSSFLDTQIEAISKAKTQK